MDKIVFSNGKYSIQVVENEGKWNDALLQFSDSTIYQTIQFASQFNPFKKFTPYIIYKENDIKGMILTRDYLLPFIKGGICKALNAPIFRKIEEKTKFSDFQEIIELLSQFYSNKKNIMVILTPLLFNEELCEVDIDYIKNNFRVIPSKYETFLLNLHNNLEDLRKNFEQKWRNALNKSERSDLKISSGTSIEFQKNFLTLFNQMLKVKNFKLFVNPEKFLRLNDKLPEKFKLKIFLCYKMDEVIAGAVISYITDYATYLFGATNELGRKYNASYFLHFHIIEYLKNNNVKIYDLGGINKIKNPGVYNFKKGFNGLHRSSIPRIILGKNSILSKIIG